MFDLCNFQVLGGFCYIFNQVPAHVLLYADFSRETNEYTFNNDFRITIV